MMNVSQSEEKGRDPRYLLDGETVLVRRGDEGGEEGRNDAGSKYDLFYERCDDQITLECRPFVLGSVAVGGNG